EAALDEAGDGGIGADAADARDLRPRARPDVRDDRERLERGPREALVDRAVVEARAGGGRRLRRAEGPPARDVLEHDPAASLAVALAEEVEGGGDALGLVGGRLCQLPLAERRGRDDE